MTLIAAYVNARGAWMVGDACVDVGGTCLTASVAKVRRSGGWLIGAAGDAGACQELLGLRLPVSPAALRRRLARVPGEWQALLARPGEVWYAEHDGTLELVEGDWWACGAAGDMALGALAVSPAAPLDVARLLVDVADAVAGLRCDVRPPFAVVSILLDTVL